MEFSHLHYFQVVAKEEHITKAAELLNITQPALSNAISLLEKELGVDLFDRVGRNIKLSSNGKIMLDYTNQIFNTLSDMKSQATDLRMGRQGTITIGSSFPRRPGSTFVAMVSRFMDENPRVSIRYLELSPKELFSGLKSREIDIAFTLMDYDNPDFDSILVYSEPLGCHISPDNYLYHKKHLYLDDLREQTFFANSPSTDLAFLTEHICKKAGFIPRIQVVGDMPGFITKEIQKNLGVALIPEASLSNLEIPHIRFKPIEDNFCCRDYSLVMLKGRYVNTAMLNFTEFAIDWFKSHEAK